MYVYLKQLSTSKNCFNGAPSDLLSVVVVPNKQFVAIVRLIEFKYLVGDAITGLALEVTDENNEIIFNRGLQINAVLKIV